MQLTWCINIYIYICIYICVCRRIHFRYSLFDIYFHIYTHIYIYIYLYICIYTCANTPTAPSRQIPLWTGFVCTEHLHRRTNVLACCAMFLHVLSNMCPHIQVIERGGGAPAVGPGGGRPPRGLGRGGGKPQKTLQSTDRLHKTPTDSTKTQNDYTKSPKDFTKPQILSLF